MKVLAIGDIVGRGGRKAVRELVPQLIKEFGVDFCVVNGENMADGRGLNKKVVRNLDDCGVDCITTGDHIWDQKAWGEDILEFPHTLRPANLHEGQPGKGYRIFETVDGTKVGVVNLLGRVYIGMPCDCPFTAAEKIIAKLREETSIIIVDFHAEATSEKIAMGRHLDGKASFVFGTHTHVETADSRIFEKGTAYQTDLGMVGSRDSILGRHAGAIVRKFHTGMPSRFNVVDNHITLCGAVVEIDNATGKAISIERIKRDLD